MKTAEQLLKEKFDIYIGTTSVTITNKEDILSVMREFAKLHVEEALKEASNSVRIHYRWEKDGVKIEPYLEKDSIINCYPNTNII